MKPVLQYILEMLACSGVFLAVYGILPKKAGGFVRLRVYIIVCAILSVVLPWVEIPVYPPDFVWGRLLSAEHVDRMEDMSVFVWEGTEGQSVKSSDDISEAPVSPGKDTPALDGNVGYMIAVLVYILVASVMAAAMVVRLGRIRSLRKRSAVTEVRKGRLRYTIAECNDIPSPFSFMKTIYLGCHLEGVERNMVITHECSHIRHGHSEERLFMSAMRILFWFNPFIWMFGKKLEEVQEFEADRDVLAEGYDTGLYRLIIFKQLFGYYPEISCGLKNSLSKRRFIMMTDKNGTRFAAVRWIAAMVLVSGTAFLSGATTASPESGVPASEPEAGRGEYVYAGEQGVADTLVIEISDKGKSIVLNGNASVGMEVLAGDLSAVKADIAVIRAEEDTPMGTIADIKQLLRKSGILKLIYGTLEKEKFLGEDAPVRLLPPPANDEVDIVEPDKAMITKKINGNSLVSVKVDKTGRISVYVGNEIVRTGDGQTEFAGAIAEIIKSNPDVFVNLQIGKESEYGVYRYATEQIDKAYFIVRNDYAIMKFGKPFDKLAKEEADVVKSEVLRRVFETEPHTTR